MARPDHDHQVSTMNDDSKDILIARLRKEIVRLNSELKTANTRLELLFALDRVHEHYEKASK
jgi:hypothetical protein